MKPRVAVIGLDCAAPQLLFDAWLGDLPNIKSLVDRGAWGRLRSIDPPITVPAWSCMFSSRDPGQLGIYGFRNRKDYSYDGLAFANSDSIHVDRVWEILSHNGKHVIVLSVPQTYPPKSVRGELVGCFLTPDTHVNEYTHPPELKNEIHALLGGDYMVDVKNFRSDDRDRILDEIYQMTDGRFEVANHLLESREDWDFFAMVEMGTDRIHHAFWSFLDPTHSKYVPGNDYEVVIHDYYVYLDEQIGRLMQRFDEQTTVLVVSDHGAQKMDGGICVNEWLLQNGYLTLKELPETPTPLGKAAVDWSRTKAWGEGGYYCRLFLNVKGREPEGVVEPDEYESVRDELIQKLEALGDASGQPIGTRVFRPEDLWEERNGIAPDLIIYWGNLLWRSVGTVGGGKIHTFENDTGPDDANHAPEGVFLMAGPGVPPGHVEGLRLQDVAPTILDRFGLPIPPEMIGKVVFPRSESPNSVPHEGPGRS